MLENQIANYVDNLQSLRDFLELLDPVLRNDVTKVFKKSKPESFVPFVMAMRKLSQEAFESDISDEQLLKKYEGEIEIVSKEVDGEKVIESIRYKGKYAVNTGEFLIRLTRSLKRIHLLYKSSLVTLMSNVEWFFSEILHAYFSSYPSAIGADEKLLTLEDLSRFESIEEARDYVIEKKVENIMRKSLREWIDILKKKPKLTMSYLKSSLDTMQEVQKRRNLLVHNDGIVNHAYLSDLPEELRSGVKIGDNINVELDYINSSIELFELNGILIGAELWKKISPSDEKRAELLHRLTYSNLEKKRWKISEGLSCFCMKDSKTSQLYKKLAKLNYWLSIKRQGRWEEIVKEAESEDFSVDKRRYRLGWLALCEKKDEFFKLVPEVIKVGDITIKELKKFPIFEEVRKDPRFSKISIKKSKAKKATKKTRSAKKHKTKKTKKKS